MGMGPEAESPFVGDCSGPGKRQCLIQGCGHWVERRSEALWRENDRT